jgi:hypothetical protein
MTKSLIRLFLSSVIIIFSFHTADAAKKKSPVISDTARIRVNMEYMVQNLTFDPATDSVFITTYFNEPDTAAYMRQLPGTQTYEVTYVLPTRVNYSYFFVIHKPDTILHEKRDSLTRIFRMKDTAMTVLNYFSDYNPATLPMRFNCDMYYQVRAGHFSPSADYLDVAGNFNNGGANDVLFADSKDSIFSAVLFLDTALLQNPILQFKFRFNGDWATAELQGEYDRTYVFHDTTGNNPNVFTCWYNNIDPNVPALPIAYGLGIQDSLVVKHTLTGYYTYEDYNLRPEGKTQFKWYHADTIGGPLITIDTAGGRITDQINYTLDTLIDLHKYVVFEVTPVTDTLNHDSIVGLPVRVYSTGWIAGVGINEHSDSQGRIYPNPTQDALFVETFEDTRQIDLVDMKGVVMLSMDKPSGGMQRLSLERLAPGPYFVIVYGKGMRRAVTKVVVGR